MLSMDEYNAVIEELRNTEDSDLMAANLASLSENYQEALTEIAQKDSDLQKATEKIKALNDNNTELLLKVTKKADPAPDVTNTNSETKTDWAGKLFEGGSMYNV